MVNEGTTPRRVLVIEDEADIADLIVAILGMEGYEARAASGGHSVEIARDFRPDVVLLDLMMPDLDGFEVARLLRQDARTAQAKVVIMTAMHGAAEYSQELGAAGYILKPFDVGDLLHAVQDVDG